jgi:glycine/D-amino acid oxidase-like deaminating enzyme
MSRPTPRHHRQPPHPRTGGPEARHDLERRYRARSLWLDGLPGPLLSRPPLPGDITCDVVIVGAGFTGLWTAYYLKRLQPDARVVVVEREIAGFGPSGRNGGWVSSRIAGSWGVYAARCGVDPVLRAERTTYQAVDEIGSVVDKEGIDCGFTKAGMLLVASSAPQASRLRAELDAARQRGIGEEDLRLLQRVDVDGLARLSDCRLAIFSPHAARIDPARLARGLADACERMGAVIYEGTEAVDIGPRRVRCRGGVVTADYVIRATESYTTQLPGQGLRYLPLYSLMIATEPLPPDVWKEIGWRDGLVIGDRHHLFFYAQRTMDGRIAIGGRGAPYRLSRPIQEAAERDTAVRARLEKTIRREFPAAAGAAVTHHWGGPLAVPRDWCMSITYNAATGFGWAGGYSGHGVVAASISGRTLADLVLDRKTDLVALPWVGHRSRRWEPEPLRYLASKAIVRVLGSADRYEDRSNRPARRCRLLAPVLPPS